MTNFDELCKTLNIDSLHPKQEDLTKLILWCENNLSTDQHVEGKLQERFNAYREFIKDVIENVLPHINAGNLTVPNKALDGMTPLELVVERGLDVYLKTLQASQGQLNTKVNGITLLHLAGVNGNLHTTEALLTLGANLLEKNTKGGPTSFFTLMLPISHDEKLKTNKQQIYQLLRSNSDNLFNERNETGDSVLHIMAVNGYDELIKDMLGKSKELVFVANNSLRYPIHSAVLNAQHSCVSLLVAVEGAAQLEDAKGQNALHYAAKYGDNEMVNICLNSSIPKDCVDKRKKTPLILAAIAQNSSAIDALLNAGAVINHTDDQNKTALHYAVQSSDINIVTKLLATPGIDVNITDTASHNPLDLIQPDSVQGKEIRDLLIEKEATPNGNINNSI